jgi:hypothetical protein
LEVVLLPSASKDNDPAQIILCPLTKLWPN